MTGGKVVKDDSFLDNVTEQIAGLSPAKRALFELKLKEKLGRSSQEHPILPRANRESAPLSFDQERLWFLDQWEPHNPAYNIPLAIGITGRLQVAVLQQSLNEIVRRHEVLRTVFSAVNGRPVQSILPALTLSLPIVDLERLPPNDRHAEVERLAVAEAQRPFDLTQGPLVRATVLRLEEEEHVLLLTMHHIVSDGWSLGVFYRELSAFYEAFSAGKPSPLPDLPIQYADFALWQREWLQGELLESLLAYWRQQLAGVPPLELPTDRPRPTIRTFRGAHEPLNFSRSLADALKSLSREEGVTLFMTLLAAFQTLLSRYTGQDDVAVGAPIANRHRVELEALVGFFVNTLVLRANLSGNPTFRQLLTRVRDVVLGALTHQHLPFEKLVAQLHPARDPARNPLFQVMFALQNAPREILKLPNLTLKWLDIETGIALFDLTVSLVEEADELSGKIGYSTDLFDAATIKRMAGHFQTLLGGIVANPDERIGSLPMLTEAERRQVIYEWNETRREYPHDKCVHRLIEEQVERAPDQIAVIHGEHELTYAELNQRSNQLAHYLQKKGVGPETLVALNLERSPELVMAALAVLKAGGAFVGLDPSHPADRLSYVLHDTGARFVITRDSLIGQVASSNVEIVPIDSAWSEISLESTANPDSAVRSDNLAYVVYTSGSTGRPKGILVTHRSFVNFALSVTERYGVSAADRRLQFASPSSELFVSGTFSTFVRGATLVHWPEPEFPSVADFVRLIEEKRLSWFTLPSAYWHEWMALVRDGRAHIPSSLRTLVLGMDKIRPDLFEVWKRQVGPRIRLFNAYGPAETTCVSSIYHADVPASEDLISIPIGRPIANTRIYLLDHYLNPVPIGVIGEVYIGGDGVARGYVGRPDLTAERFVPDCFSDIPGERLYRTGDLARYRPDGNIEFIGRADYQVKVRGYRVELEEIEAVLRQHPMVRQAVVVAQKEDAGDKRLAAYVVGHRDASINLTELRQFLRERLPDYMVPSAFKVMEKFPMTRTGKVDRLALPAAEPIRSEPDEDFVAPRTEMESLLAAIWQEALKVDRVGAYDNFFNLGGHSLLSLQVIDKIEKQIGVRITPKDLIFQTLAQLAAACDHARREGLPSEPVGAAKKLWSGLKKVVLGAGEERR